MISFVIQGSIGPYTATAATYCKQIFRDCEVILSTFEGQNISGIKYDKLVISPDPGAIKVIPELHYINREENNVNRQIVASLAGIRQAKNNLVCSMRGDIHFTHRSILLFPRRFPRVKHEYKLFNSKIIIPHIYTSDPKSCLFHPSDFLFFGMKPDLLNLFDIPLQSEEDQRYVPENYIFIKCLQKKFPDVDITEINDPCGRMQRQKNPEYVELTLNLFANNFVVVDFPHQTGCFCAKYPHLSHQRGGVEFIGHRQWLQLYRTRT